MRYLTRVDGGWGELEGDPPPYYSGIFIEIWQARTLYYHYPVCVIPFLDVRFRVLWKEGTVNSVLLR
jgi:hypothetical protein